MRENPLGPLPIGLRIRKVLRNDDLVPEGFQVVNRRGEILREFVDPVDAETYKDFMEGLKICEVDMLIFSMMKRIETLERGSVIVNCTLGCEHGNGD